MNFHYLFASGRSGWAVKELEDEHKNLDPLFALIVADVPAPKPIAFAGDDFPFTMLVTTLEADPYLGRVLTGRIETGAMTVNRVIKVLNGDGKEIERARVTKLLAFRGLARVPVARAEGRRHHRHRRASDRHRRRHAVRHGRDRGYPRHADRSADPGDDRVGQRLAAGGGAKATRCRAASSASGCCARPKAMSPSMCARPPTAPTKSPAAANSSSAC